jgi:glycosidase
MRDIRDTIHTLLANLYDKHQVEKLYHSIWQRVETFNQQNPQFLSNNLPSEQLNETDAILILYGDQFQMPDCPPLKSLALFLEAHLQDVINSIHILPFHPYSSDDGFSVIDYRQVSPALGTWQDISRLGGKYRLMFDLVINHISSQSVWFQNFLKGKQPYTNYFHILDPKTDLSSVVRPRSTPVLTPFQTSDGLRYVWTTFSTDQIDLNYSNPEVLLEMIEILLHHVARGAKIIRLDAIAYLWKIPGSSCIHLPQTHAIVKLLRAILDAAAPSVLLITETNVPHEENISYFGTYVPEQQRSDEAQMVYQFPLGPLILHTFITGDATRLTNWAEKLPGMLPGTTWLNFTASHDGIGVRPAEGLLRADEIQALTERTTAHGGQISYRFNPDGSQSAYELNITWYDALNDPANPNTEMDIRRFLASQAIMLAFAGVPGIYIHSLFGSHNCSGCLEETGRARSINREKFFLEDLNHELDDPNSLKARILAGYRQLLLIRRQQTAFSPAAEQSILCLDPGIFALQRTAADEARLICLTNITSNLIQTEISSSNRGKPGDTEWIDLLSDEVFPGHQKWNVNLGPYQTRWLRESPETQHDRKK